MQRATQTFHVGTENGPRTITAGDLLEDNDPIVKGREIYFDAASDEPKPVKKTPARRTSAKSTAKKDD